MSVVSSCHVNGRGYKVFEVLFRMAQKRASIYGVFAGLASVPIKVTFVEASQCGGTL